MNLDICPINNHIIRFSPGLFNTISYFAIHLKYITLIIKTQISIFKNVKAYFQNLIKSFFPTFQLYLGWTKLEFHGSSRTLGNLLNEME